MKEQGRRGDAWCGNHGDRGAGFPGHQCEGRPRGEPGTWELLWAHDWGRGRQTMSGFPWLLGVVFGGRGRAGGQTSGCRPGWGGPLTESSRRALGVPGEAAGAAQTAAEPGVPAPDPLGPCDPHAPGEARGGLPPRGAAPACRLRPIPSLGQSPLPRVSPLFPGVAYVCLVAPPPMPRVPRVVTRSLRRDPFLLSARVSVFFLRDVTCLYAVFPGHLPLSRLWWSLSLFSTQRAKLPWS